MKFRGSRPKSWRTIQRGLWSVALLLSSAAPGIAAERLTLRVGPFEQSISVSDLERFAETGEVPSSLQLYAPFLTSDVRKALTSSLQIDPNQGTRVVGDLLRSPAGEQVLKSLQLAVPNVTVEQLQAGFFLAATQANGLNAISVLKAVPKDEVTVDVTEAIGVASQINLPYWQSQALGSLLEKDLSTDESFRAAFDPATRGTYSVQKQTLYLQDRQRNRRISVDLYWGKRNARDPSL